MKFLKFFGIGLLILLSLGLLLLALSPLFVAIDAFLGMEPVIICAAIVILGFAISFLINNPYLEKIFGYLLGATILGVIIYYVLMAIFGASIQIWIVFVIIAAIAIPAFFTSVLQNIPFIGAKIIPPMWIISIFIAFLIIFTNTVAK